MLGSQGNPNLVTILGHQFVTYDGTSDAATLNPNTGAVTLYATTDCYVRWGAAPTAAAPSGEKVFVGNQTFVPAGIEKSIPVPDGSDSVPMKLAVIQASATGTLYIDERG